MAKKKPSMKALFLVIDGAFYDVKRLTVDTWNGLPLEPNSFLLRKGDATTYVVQSSGCSCEHFSFRHNCKHVDSLQEAGLLKGG